eukprot:scaffold65654_cov48-Attheya_sp.AAC.3
MIGVSRARTLTGIRSLARIQFATQGAHVVVPVGKTGGSRIAFFSSVTKESHDAVCRGSLWLKCADSLGVVSGMSECFHSHGSNLTNADMHVEHSQRVSGLLLDNDNNKEDLDTFISRFSFEYPRQMDLESFETSVANVVGSYEHAEGSLLLHSGRHVVFQTQDHSGVLTNNDDASSKVMKRVMRSSGSPRMGVLVSRTEH